MSVSAPKKRVMQRVKDRRRAGRFPLELEAHIGEEPRPLEEGEDVLIKNISSSGALFSSSGEAWERGQPVSMIIKLGKKLDPPYSYDLNLKGRIVRRNHFVDGEDNRYAVEFKSGWKVVNRTGV